jgi:predicted transcriptional regulator
MLAKKLIDRYSLKQQETANLLGITQAAISKYVRRVRGKALELESVPGIQALTDKVADSKSSL